MRAVLLAALGAGATIAVADSALRALLMVIRLLPRRKAPRPAASPPGTRSYVLLVPAQDEEGLIADTVQALGQIDWPAERRTVIVVADRCRDATAERARAAGAVCLERHHGGIEGKAGALGWFAQHPEASRADAIAIFDADSRPDADFLRAVDEEIAVGAAAVQGKVAPASSSTAAAGATGCAEALAQEMEDRARRRLGWPAPLRGTGMVVAAPLFRTVAPLLRTRIEDTELSLLLASRGIHPVWCPEAVVHDPKPESVETAALQRSRWLRGLSELWRIHWRLIVRLLLAGSIGTRALVWSVLARPRTVMATMKGALLVAALVADGHAGNLLAAACGAALAIDLAYAAGGAISSGARGSGILRLGWFVPVWLRALYRTVARPQPWPRARPKRGDPPRP